MQMKNSKNQTKTPNNNSIPAWSLRPTRWSLCSYILCGCSDVSQRNVAAIFHEPSSQRFQLRKTFTLFSAPIQSTNYKYIP